MSDTTIGTLIVDAASYIVEPSYIGTIVTDVVAEAAAPSLSGVLVVDVISGVPTGPIGPAWTYWDGVQELPANVAVWDGAQEQPMLASEIVGG